MDRQALAASGLRLSGVTSAYDDTSVLIVSLTTTDRPFHVLLRVEGAETSPEIVADDVLALLATDPSTWDVSYFSIGAGGTSRPSMAGPGWTLESFEAN